MDKENKIFSRKSEIWEKIYKNFEGQVNDLNNLYSHQGIKGGENEKAFMEFCKSFLPGKFELEQNIVLLDQDGKQSTEQDIIIWNSYEQPRVFAIMDKIFLLETVLMCIEIKTTLDKRELEKILLKIRDLRNLNYFKRLEGNKQWQIHPPLYFIFAFDCVWNKRGNILKTITDIIKEYEIKPSERFDYLYIMRKGVSLNWDIPIKFPKRGYGFAVESLRERYNGKLPYNDRWPQFFPSKLIKDIPLELCEYQIYDVGKFDEENFNNLETKEQVYGMVSFLRDLCQALEDQKILHSHGQVVLSYPTSKDTRKGGRCSPEPF